jgi:uncharacterized damage-inducible protein DinB
MPGRPDETEYAAWAKGYVAAVDGDDVVQALTTQLTDFLTLVAPLDGAYSYAPGKWTVNQILGHVTDAERIFAYRALRVARNDQTPFPGFEQDDYLAHSNFNDRSLADLLAEFEAVRRSNIYMVRGFPAEAWTRRGTVSGHSVTTRGLVFQLAGHERHHARILREYVK